MSRALPAHIAQNPHIWRGQQAQASQPTLASGHEALDRHLPGHGWPTGALTELLSQRPGLGELSLLLPALSRMTRQCHWIILVNPPWTPYPPAMRGHDIDLQQVLLIRSDDIKQSLWACEQALRGVRGGAVLAWLPPAAGFVHLRRLQLAAQAGHKAAFVFRPASTAGKASPASLRIHLQADDADLRLTLLKGRSIRPGTSIRIRRPHQAPGLPAHARISDLPEPQTVGHSIPAEPSLPATAH